MPEGKRWIGEQLCSTHSTIGEVESTVVYTLRRNRVVAVGVSFKSDAFGDMEAIFIARYGKPTKTGDAPVRTAGGESFTNRIHTWDGQNVHITLRRYGIKITESLASLQTVDETNEALRLNNERRGKAAKEDL